MSYRGCKNAALLVSMPRQIQSRHVMPLCYSDQNRGYVWVVQGFCGGDALQPVPEQGDGDRLTPSSVRVRAQGFLTHQIDTPLVDISGDGFVV